MHRADILPGSDPDYRKEWSRPGDAIGGWWDLTRCSPASPGWRAYFLPRMVQILEDYELDGLYNDWGYVPNARKQIKEPAQDEMVAFEETPQYDGAMTDLLVSHLLGSEATRRHLQDARGFLPTSLRRAGSRSTTISGWERTSTMPTACAKRPRTIRLTWFPVSTGPSAKVEGESDHFLHSIPYMQFPLLQGGRPLTGERAVIPIPRLPGVTGERVLRSGVEILPGASERPLHLRRLGSAFRPTPRRGRPTPAGSSSTCRWWKTEPGRIWRSPTRTCSPQPLPEDCVASAFANRDLYLVLANYGQSPQQVETADAYVPADDLAAAPAKQWQLQREE